MDLQIQVVLVKAAISIINKPAVLVIPSVPVKATQEITTNMAMVFKNISYFLILIV